MPHVNPNWLREQSSKFSSANFQGSKHEVVVSYNKSAQALILELSNLNIPFKVLNLGAGVKKITNNLGVCPKCNGSGKC